MRFGGLYGDKELELVHRLKSQQKMRGNLR